jgi:plastocyanin
VGAARLLAPSLGLLLGVALVLMPFVGPVAAQGGSTAPAPSSAAVPASAVPSIVLDGAAIPVTLVDFHLEPPVIEAAGTTLTFDVVNQGPTPHNLTIRDAAGTVLGATPDLSRGQTAQLVLTLPGPGTYVTFCSLPGHASLGVVGELIVTTAGAQPSPSIIPLASPSTSSPA